MSKTCGLCGNKKNLIKTDCCGEWICDDEHTYQLFSYARNSCSRNHRRYTLCGFHAAEEHTGHWTECEACQKSFSHELEMYVYYGTNEYNFEKLKNPPEYEPTTCKVCKSVINLGIDGYTTLGKDYWCENCPTE